MGQPAGPRQRDCRSASQAAARTALHEMIELDEQRASPWPSASLAHSPSERARGSLPRSRERERQPRGHRTRAFAQIQKGRRLRLVAALDQEGRSADPSGLSPLRRSRGHDRRWPLRRRRRREQAAGDAPKQPFCTRRAMEAFSRRATVARAARPTQPSPERCYRSGVGSGAEQRQSFAAARLPQCVRIEARGVRAGPTGAYGSVLGGGGGPCRTIPV